MNEKDEAMNEKDEAMNEKDGATVTWPRWMRQESGVQGGSAGIGASAWVARKSGSDSSVRRGSVGVGREHGPVGGVG